MNHSTDLIAGPAQGASQARVSPGSPGDGLKHGPTGVLVAPKARIRGSVGLVIGRVEKVEADLQAHRSGVRCVVAPDLAARHTPVDKLALQAYLQQASPAFEVVPRQSFLVVKKSGWVGANVVVKNNKVLVFGNFGSMGLQMAFMLCVVLLGFLIPIVLYLIFVFGKQRALEKEVGAVVQQCIVGGAPQVAPAGFALAM